MLSFITILSSSLYKAKNPHLKNVVHINISSQIKKSNSIYNKKEMMSIIS